MIARLRLEFSNPNEPQVHIPDLAQHDVQDSLVGEQPKEIGGAVALAGDDQVVEPLGMDDVDDRHQRDSQAQSIHVGGHAKPLKCFVRGV